MEGKLLIFIIAAVVVPTAVFSKETSGEREQELDQKLSNHSDGTPWNEVTTKRPTFDEQNNWREFTGNWNNSLKNKDQSNTPNRTRLNLNDLLQERSKDISKKTLQPRSTQPFSKLLFENARLSVPIRERALKTKFIHGMATGLLSPTQYGRYMIQDTAYLDNANKVYSEAAQMMEEQGDGDAAVFYRGQAAKYEDYYQEFLKTWHLKSAEEVEAGPALQAYMGYQQAVVKKHPRYLPISMLPCTMLWPWMARSLIEKVDKEKNPYYEDWFVKNLREPDTRSSTERFVDESYAAFNEDIAVKIFCEGMMSELNFFREACDEGPLKLSDVCPNAKNFPLQ